VADGGDCDDGEAGVHPEAEEVPGDGVDQDCDGVDAAEAGGVPLSELGVAAHDAAGGAGPERPVVELLPPGGAAGTAVAGGAHRRHHSSDSDGGDDGLTLGSAAARRAEKRAAKVALLGGS
jgi:hypothetical protein